jgi:hypothetical protein
MKYHYRKGVQVGWSLGKCIDGIAIAGWLLLLAMIIDTMLLDGQLLTKVLMR